MTFWARGAATPVAGMAIAAAAVIAVGAVAAGCGGTESESSTSTPAAKPSGQARPGAPAADAPIRGDAAWAADALTRTDAALDRAVDAWRTHGDPARGEPPDEVVRYALYQQRVYRFLARRPALAGRTVAKLRRPLAAQAADNVTATRDLLSLTHPARTANVVRTQAPQPAGVLLGHFQRAGRRFGVSWQVLAAVMQVESRFGRVKSA